MVGWIPYFCIWLLKQVQITCPYNSYLKGSSILLASYQFIEDFTIVCEMPRF